MDEQPSWRPLEGTAHAVAVEALIHGPLARGELARRLNLSPATLTRTTKPLLDAGLLVETGPQPAAGLGRPSLPLDVNPDFQYFIGVKLTTDEVHGVLTNLRAQVLATEVRPLLQAENPSAPATTRRLSKRAQASGVETPGGMALDPDTVADAVARMVAELRPRVPVVTSVGVSAAGIVSDAARLVSPAYLGWDTPVPLAELVAVRTGLPVVLANDVEAWTQAELWFGSGRDVEGFALVTTGAGIGYDVVTHGRAATSPDVGVGNAGHIPLDPLGPLCAEGHPGCAKAMLTSGAIAAAVGIGLGRMVTFDEALVLAHEGNPVATRVVHAAARAEGRLLAIIANLTFVPLIIVSGDGVDLALGWEEMVRAEFAANRRPLAGRVEIIIKRAPFTEWARGAAVVAIQTHVLGR